MARINIEDSLFKDQRFTDLCIKLGSRPLALGWLVEAWLLAQEGVSADNPSGVISVEKWKARRMCDLILEVGLAEVCGGQIEMAGADKSFNWLIQRQAAASKGGIARAEKYKNQALMESAGIVPTGSRPASGLSPLTPSPTLTPLKENLTLITKSVVGGENPKTAAKAKFRVHSKLQHPAINDILATIAESTQTRWLKLHEDPKVIRDDLVEAVSFYSARGDDLSEGWGVVLHKALQRARAKRLTTTAAIPEISDDINSPFWKKVFGDGAEETV